MTQLFIFLTVWLAFSPVKAQQSSCHPSYKININRQKICIPPAPPDLNCDDIPYRRFPVTPPDPHRFDGDKDGIGCERD
ncbi:MAG: excalibur calcium-binding domain-containing protein [Cyanobacteriota bacterium]|nr:excalibur calcium-binding domain-containing protein [Cyanobacteriota bacterium]